MDVVFEAGFKPYIPPQFYGSSDEALRRTLASMHLKLVGMTFISAQVRGRGWHRADFFFFFRARSLACVLPLPSLPLSFWPLFFISPPTHRARLSPCHRSGTWR